MSGDADTVREALLRAPGLAAYYERLPEGVTSEAGAEAQNLTRDALAALARLEAREAQRDALAEALERYCDDTGYCYVCDSHPSKGHANDCALAEAATREEQA